MRPYELPEYDRDALERYMERDSLQETPPFGPVDVELDADSSPSRLFNRIFRNAFPKTYDTDFTVRAETILPEQRHALSLLYTARTGFLLSLSTLTIVWLSKTSPDLVSAFARPLVIQSFSAAVLHAVFLRAWREITPLLFVIAMIMAFMVAIADHDLIVAAGCILLHALVLVLVTADRPAATLRRAILLIACYTVAILVANPVTRPILLPPVTAVVASAILLFCYVLTKHVVQWMVANRATSHATVRAYDDFDNAEPDAIEIRRLTMWFYAGSLVAFLSWCLSLLTFETLYIVANGHPWRQILTALTCLIVLLGIHIAHWLFAELCCHRRSPKLAACFRSWFVAWRCLTVWIAYAPVLRAPMVFNFPQPWASRTFRLFILSLTLLAIGAVPIGFAWDWTWTNSSNPPVVSKKEFQPTFQTPRVDVRQISSEAPPADGLFYLFDYRVVLAIVAYLTVVPPVLLWLTVAAICGPALTAAHDRFELRDESVVVPNLK